MGYAALQDYGSTSSDSGYYQSWQSLKTEKQIKTEYTPSFWERAAMKTYDAMRSVVSFVAKAIESVCRFFTNLGGYIAWKVSDMFKPLHAAPPVQSPDKNIGYFEFHNGVFDFSTNNKPIDLLSPAEAQTVKSTDALSRKMGLDDPQAFVPTLYSHGNGAVTVDMPLNWFSAKQDDSDIPYDVRHPIEQSSRWTKSVEAAAKEVTALIDSKQCKLIEVGGVNVANGLGTEQINEVLKRVKIPEGAVLVVGHSAGTHAITLAMSQIKRDKDQVYWLLLSPRLTPQTTESLIRKSGVNFNHVLSINNRGDLPHSVRPLGNPTKWHVNQAYDSAPWTHVWLESGVKVKYHLDGTAYTAAVDMDHGTMYNNLANDVSFVYRASRERGYQMNTLSEIVNDRLFTRDHENTVQ